MHLDPFDLHRPTSIDETIDLARSLAGKFDYLAGGTDLLPNYKMHLNLRPNLIALTEVEELHGHRLDRIGAMSRLADLEEDAEFGRTFPILAEAIQQVATPLVRASATVGGNLLVETRCFFFNQSQFWRESLGFCLKADGDRCHVVPQKEKCYATFSGDLAPALEVLDAEVEIAGPSGRRRTALTEFYDAGGDGIRRHHLANGELLVAVHLPESARRRVGNYQKLRVRPSFDFPELSIAIAGRMDQGVVTELGLAVGGLETFPKRFDALTQPYIGRPLSDEHIDALATEVERKVRPVHNTFLLPDYRKQMSRVYVRRGLRRFREEASRS
ncbi:MAG: FAD binding domain-containing protein [Thermoplasmata archaeon]